MRYLSSVILVLTFIGCNQPESNKPSNQSQIQIKTLSPSGSIMNPSAGHNHRRPALVGEFCSHSGECAGSLRCNNGVCDDSYTISPQQKVEPKLPASLPASLPTSSNLIRQRKPDNESASQGEPNSQPTNTQQYNDILTTIKNYFPLVYSGDNVITDCWCPCNYKAYNACMGENCDSLYPGCSNCYGPASAANWHICANKRRAKSVSTITRFKNLPKPKYECGERIVSDVKALIEEEEKQSATYLNVVQTNSELLTRELIDGVWQLAENKEVRKDQDKMRLLELFAPLNGERKYYCVTNRVQCGHSDNVCFLNKIYDRLSGKQKNDLTMRE